MPQDDTIRAEGVVVESLANRMCRVRLPNGHRVLGYCAARSGLTPERMAPGARVRVEMTPYDMSKARIVGVVEQKSVL